MQFVSLDFIVCPFFIFGVELEPNSARLIYEFVYAYWNFSTNSLVVGDHEESHDVVYVYAKKQKVHVWLPALQVKLIVIFHFFYAIREINEMNYSRNISSRHLIIRLKCLMSICNEFLRSQRELIDQLKR